jgi:RND superfamily putative drug exporter
MLGQSAWWLPRWLDKILPTLDVEGEGLAHQLALRDWPTPDDDHLVLADGVRVAGTDRDLAVAVRPGEVLVIDGEVGAGKSALLLTLAGRMKLRTRRGDRARVKIAGLVLPQLSAAVRRRTAVIDCVRTEAPATELDAIDKASPAVVFVDHADVLERGADTGALTRLIERTVADGRAVVLTARDRALVEDRIDGEYRYLTLGAVPDLADARL